MAVEGFAADRHLELIEGVLHHIVGVEFIYFAYDDVNVGHQWVGKE
jgi:hypothetical protein